MKVSMIPDNSVKMIHASQDDAGRRWEFELYDEDGLIDVSSVGEQMFYPVYQGGTEQILPENTSTPTTSPLIADIVYPDELREEQEFLYRECPSAEDGQAKIKKVYGQTLKWNQACSKTTSVVISGDSSISITVDADGYIVVNGTPNADTVITPQPSVNPYTVPANHKYMIMCEGYQAGFEFGRTGFGYVVNTKYFINSYTSAFSGDPRFRIKAGVTYNFKCRFSAFDLTKMSDIFANMTDAQIKEWFDVHYPLNYYAFNAGTLIPFMGEQIKTTGRNLVNKAHSEQGGIDANGNYSSEPTLWRGNEFIPVTEGQTYTFSSFGGFLFSRIYYYDSAYNFVYPRLQSEAFSPITFTIPNGIKYVKWSLYKNDGNITSEVIEASELQLSKGSTIAEYEPYIESIVNLPTLTYFADGMKSAGSVYDELTENLASKRVGKVDLGTLPFYRTTWGSSGQFYIFQSTLADSALFASNVVANAISAIYSTVSGDNTYTQGKDKTLAINISGTNAIVGIIDNSYTTVEDFKAAMSGQYLYYELAEPVETPIASASLVSQNQEIPMIVEDDKLVAYSTSEITEQSGFHDTKIKLSNDGVAYSAKFTLHVERKP